MSIFDKDKYTQKVPSYVPLFQQEEYKMRMQSVAAAQFLKQYRKEKPGAVLHLKKISTQEEVVVTYLQAVDTLRNYQEKGLMDANDIQGLVFLLDRHLFRAEVAEINKMMSFVERRFDGITLLPGLS